jgi:exopolyphosphatase/guanosine-5'-triphosphate,3'-diphosphate pyrophosphatase
MSEEPKPSTNRQFAAIDLGSNSFHLVVAQEGDNGLFTVVDRIKENVRLAAGLGEDGTLSEAAQGRALKCLKRLGERLGDLPPSNVRAVGTNTLRKGKHVVQFLADASQALGHPIDVISGREEARLIYRGVVRAVEAPGRLLVIDIGGGSTELILGEAHEPTRLDSLFMGHVSWSRRFFPDGEVTVEAMEEAEMAARRELQGVVRIFRKAGWDSAVGSSGTIVGIERMLQAKGYATINEEGLNWLKQTLIRAEHMVDVDIEGLSENRRMVLPGGVAILSALFTGLRLRELRATNHALREGVLLELVGRERFQDLRDTTVRHLMERFEIDGQQAFRVQQTALELFDQVKTEWHLKERHRQVLKWATSLHEMGLFLTYSGYHKHGSYLLTHLEMPGFSRQDQRCIAALVRSHRGKPTREKIAEVAPMWDRKILHLVVLLRLATRIHRRRSPKPSPTVVLSAHSRGLNLSFPDGWLEARPLSRADLEEDAVNIRGLGYTLKVV